jgi:hypothetical protein
MPLRAGKARPFFCRSAASVLFRFTGLGNLKSSFSSWKLSSLKP